MGNGHLKKGDYKRLFEIEMNTTRLEWAMTALEQKAGRQAGGQANMLLEDIVSNGSIDGHVSNELYYALLS